jgi:hypothetical protein
VQKDDLRITFDAPCSRIGSNPIITVAHTDNIPMSGVPGAVEVFTVIVQSAAIPLKAAYAICAATKGQQERLAICPDST